MDKFFSNLLGVILNIPALTLNVKAWLLQENVNLLLTIFISFLAIIWWFMKIYQKHLEIKKLKKEEDHA